MHNLFSFEFVLYQLVAFGFPALVLLILFIVPPLLTKEERAPKSHTLPTCLNLEPELELSIEQVRRGTIEEVFPYEYFDRPLSSDEVIDLMLFPPSKLLL